MIRSFYLLLFTSLSKWISELRCVADVCCVFCPFGRGAQGLVWVELTNNLCQLTTLFLMSTLSSQM